MSKHRVLSLKPQLRLEWRGQDGQSETEQSNHSATLGDSITSSTRIGFLVRTGVVEIHTDQYLPLRLEKGDSCYFDSTMGHACVSAGPEDATILWVCSRVTAPLA